MGDADFDFRFILTEFPGCLCVCVCGFVSRPVQIIYKNI